MTSLEIRTALSETVAQAFASRYVYIGRPYTPPVNYPAVYAMWTRSEPTSATHSQRQDSGLLTAKGIKRVHALTVYVVLGLAPDGVLVDERQQEAAETLMQALEDDTTLRAGGRSDRAAKARVANVEPWNDTLSATAVFGVRAECEVVEL